MSTTIFTIVDSLSRIRTFAAESDDDGVLTLHSVLETNAGILSMTHPLPVKRLNGSTGLDFSINQPDVPLTDFELIATVPADVTRSNIEVYNASDATIQLVRDDGADAEVSNILIDPANGWSSFTFKGRLRVYSLEADDRISIFVD